MKTFPQEFVKCDQMREPGSASRKGLRLIAKNVIVSTVKEKGATANETII